MLKGKELSNVVRTFQKCVQSDPSRLYGSDFDYYAERRDLFLPQPGFVGSRYDKYRILFVLQCPAVGGGDIVLDHEKGIYNALKSFAFKPNVKNFKGLMKEMSGPMEETWARTRIIKRILDPIQLNIEFLAYKNVLTVPLARQGEFSSAGNRVTKTVITRMSYSSMNDHGIAQIKALRPDVIICIGYLTRNILKSSMPELWSKTHSNISPFIVKGIAAPRQEIENVITALERIIKQGIIL